MPTTKIDILKSYGTVAFTDENDWTTVIKCIWCDDEKWRRIGHGRTYEDAAERVLDTVYGIMHMEVCLVEINND